MTYKILFDCEYCFSKGEYFVERTGNTGDGKSYYCPECGKKLKMV